MHTACFMVGTPANFALDDHIQARHTSLLNMLRRCKLFCNTGVLLQRSMRQLTDTAQALLHAAVTSQGYVQPLIGVCLGITQSELLSTYRGHFLG